MNFEELSDRAAQAIVNSRELCGNEREAAKQVYDDDNTTMTPEDYVCAMNKAENIWRKYQAEAGVPAKYRK